MNLAPSRWRAVTACVCLSLSALPALACTAFYAFDGRTALVGNNEDLDNPNTRLWTVPAEKGAYGRLYFGYDDFYPQGGVNEKGLWFDLFAVETQEVPAAPGKAAFAGNLEDKIMAECATVAEARAVYERYSRPYMARFIAMFGDRTGASMIVEGNAILPGSGKYQIIANFRPSEHPTPSARYAIAEAILQADPTPSVARFRRILAATHQEGGSSTLYSYIADLRREKIYLYHFHNFENVVVLDVKQELARGKHVANVADYFPRTYAAEAFADRVREQREARRKARQYAAFDATTLPQFAGRYTITTPEAFAGRTLQLTAEAGHLHFSLDGAARVEVFPESPTSFFALDVGGTDVTMVFTRSDTGAVTGLEVRAGGLAATAKRAE
jgi:hypothetical protein